MREAYEAFEARNRAEEEVESSERLAQVGHSFNPMKKILTVSSY